jgi:hypothetical protein
LEIQHTESEPNLDRSIYEQKADEQRNTIARLKRNLTLALGVSAVLAIIAVWSLYQLRPAADAAKSHIEPPPGFWSRFLDRDRSTKILLPTPVFFGWSRSQLKVRDVRVNDYGDYPNSDELTALTHRFGPPILFPNYTPISDALAVTRLVQFLERQGFHVDVLSMVDFTVDEKEGNNLILIGTAGFSSRFRDLLDRTNFIPIAKGDLVRNRNPLPGEPAEFVQRIESAKRRTVPGFVGVLPIGNRGNRVLAMIGVENQALGTCVTTPSCLAEIDTNWRKQGSPTFFEAVVESNVDAGRVLSTHPIAMRPFPSK